MVLGICAVIFLTTSIVHGCKLYRLRQYKWRFIKVKELNYTSEELVFDYKKRLKRKIKVSVSLLLLTGIIFFLQQNVGIFKDSVSIDPLFSTTLFHIE